jgi:hypothetical protein
MSVKNIKATQAGIYEGKKAVSAGLADEVQAADKAITNARGKSRSMITATKSTLHTNNKEDHMNLETLKENHPDLVSQIEADARQGMVAQADATAAVTTEQTRVCSLATAMFGEEPGKKLSAVAAKGLSAEDVTTLGLTYAATAGVSEADATSRAAILKGLQAAAPEGLKGVQPAAGADADRSAAAKGIAAGGGQK